MNSLHRSFRILTKSKRVPSAPAFHHAPPPGGRRGPRAGSSGTAPVRAQARPRRSDALAAPDIGRRVRPRAVSAPSAAGFALEQPKMWLFRRRTEHRSLPFRLRRSSLPRFVSGRAEVRLWGHKRTSGPTGMFAFAQALLLQARWRVFPIDWRQIRDRPVGRSRVGLTLKPHLSQ